MNISGSLLLTPETCLEERLLGPGTLSRQLLRLASPAVVVAVGAVESEVGAAKLGDRLNLAAVGVAVTHHLVVLRDAAESLVPEALLVGSGPAVASTVGTEKNLEREEKRRKG